PTAGSASSAAWIFEAALAAASGVAKRRISLPPLLLTRRPPVESATLVTAWLTAFLHFSCRFASLLGSAIRTVAVLSACITAFYQAGRGAAMKYGCSSGCLEAF